MEKLLIIDGMNLLFRMFYGIPSSIKNKNGQEVKGVIGFLGGIKKYIKKINTKRIIVVFDSETSLTNKLEISSDYKQNRIDYSDVEENLNPFSQIEYIYRLLDHLSIFHIEVKDYEADDFIASLCEKYKDNYHNIIVSTDKDFLQLVDETISVYNPTSDTIYSPSKVVEKFKVKPSQIIDYKVLVGDPSDNIKGVRMIGPKTALKILSVGSIDEIINNEKEISSKLHAKLIENLDTIKINKALITMNKSIEINIALTLDEISDKLERKSNELLVECGVF